MKKIIFSLFVFLFSILLSAQTPQDSIIVSKTLFGTKYVTNGQKISFNKVVDILDSNESTKLLIESAKENKAVGYPILALGAVYSLSLYYTSEVANEGDKHFTNSMNFYYAAAVNLAIYCTGILCISNGNWKIKKAINRYNRNAGISSYTSELNYNIGLNYLSLTYKF